MAHPFKKEAILCSTTAEMPDNGTVLGMVYSTPPTLHHLGLLHSLGIFLKQKDLDKPGL